jgi:serine/threonine protein kinase
MASPCTFERCLAGEHALEQLTFSESRSRLPSRAIPKVQWSDVKIDMTIGTGTYCRVQRVRLNSSSGLLEDAYALKALSYKTKESETSFIEGASDLALEGSILSRLNHENIVKIHGISSGCISQVFSKPNDEGYFLVLDLLTDTLTDRMVRWRREHNSYKSSSPLSLLSRRAQNMNSIVNRLERVALGMVQGMKYLHENNVVLRDLKPENIGFSKDGGVKLFDFGFAREVHACDSNEIAGSLRYMSPENMHGNPSGHAADVYSFGLILWELCTLKTAYANLESRKDLFMHRVVTENMRPCLRSIRSKSLRTLISRCWDASPLNRPTFTEIQRELQAAILLASKKKKTPAASNTRKEEESSTTIMEKPEKAQRKVFQSTALGRIMRSFRSTVADDRSPPAITDETEDLSEFSYSENVLQQFSATIPCQKRTTKRDSAGPPALPIGQQAKGISSRAA